MDNILVKTEPPIETDSKIKTESELPILQEPSIEAELSILIGSQIKIESKPQVVRKQPIETELPIVFEPPLVIEAPVVVPEKKIVRKPLIIRKLPRARPYKVFRRQTFSDSFWYRQCAIYRSGDYANKVRFLDSEDSDPKISSKNIKCFSRKLNLYDDKKLDPVSTKLRKKPGKFPTIENAIVEFLNRPETQIQIEKCGLTWNYLKKYAVEIAESQNITNFTASTGWIQGVLERGNFNLKKNKDMEI